MSLNVLPWWTKVAAKVVLARLPVGYNWWRKLGVFRHGEMLNPDYAINVFDRHYERVKAFLPKNYTVLELGPGDSLATAIIASARGAAQVYLVDAGSFAATKDMTRYNALAQRLAQNGTPVSGAPFKTIQDMLRETNAIYLTEGINSLRVLPELSIDFIFSQAVLEHIALSEFQETMHSLFRLLRRGGISSHRVDLQDHLANSLHSLRFSRAAWESGIMANSGFYTNRLRASQILNVIQAVGYQIKKYQPNMWQELPVSQHKLHSDFANFEPRDLMVRGFDIIAHRPVS